MKKLKKILAVSTAVFVLSLSLSLPTDCVSAANSNNAVSYTVFSLKKRRNLQNKVHTKSGGHLILYKCTCCHW